MGFWIVFPCATETDLEPPTTAQAPSESSLLPPPLKHRDFRFSLAIVVPTVLRVYPSLSRFRVLAYPIMHCFSCCDETPDKGDLRKGFSGS